MDLVDFGPRRLPTVSKISMMSNDGINNETIIKKLLTHLSETDKIRFGSTNKQFRRIQRLSGNLLSEKNNIRISDVCKIKTWRSYTSNIVDIRYVNNGKIEFPRHEEVLLEKFTEFEKNKIINAIAFMYILTEDGRVELFTQNNQKIFYHICSYPLSKVNAPYTKIDISSNNKNLIVQGSDYCIMFNMFTEECKKIIKSNLTWALNPKNSNLFVYAYRSMKTHKFKIRFFDYARQQPKIQKDFINMHIRAIKYMLWANKDTLMTVSDDLIQKWIMKTDNNNIHQLINSQCTLIHHKKISGGFVEFAKIHEQYLMIAESDYFALFTMNLELLWKRDITISSAVFVDKFVLVSNKSTIYAYEIAGLIPYRKYETNEINIQNITYCRHSEFIQIFGSNNNDLCEIKINMSDITSRNGATMIVEDISEQDLSKRTLQNETFSYWEKYKLSSMLIRIGWILVRLRRWCRRVKAKAEAKLTLQNLSKTLQITPEKSIQTPIDMIYCDLIWPHIKSMITKYETPAVNEENIEEKTLVILPDICSQEIGEISDARRQQIFEEELAIRIKRSINKCYEDNVAFVGMDQGRSITCDDFFAHTEIHDRKKIRTHYSR